MSPKSSNPKRDQVVQQPSVMEALPTVVAWFGLFAAVFVVWCTTTVDVVCTVVVGVPIFLLQTLPLLLWSRVTRKEVPLWVCLPTPLVGVGCLIGHLCLRLPEARDNSLALAFIPTGEAVRAFFPALGALMFSLVLWRIVENVQNRSRRDRPRDTA